MPTSVPKSRFLVASLLRACCAAAIAVSSAVAEPVVDDDFEAAVLDPAWTITFDLVTDWTYELASSNLTATDIVLTELHGGWSNVILDQEFAPLDDFTAQVTFGWDSESTNSAMQNVMLVLRDRNGERVVAASYHDAWDGNQGRVTILIGETPYNGLNNLPHSGTGSFEIRREAGLITVTWEDEELLTGTLVTPIEKLELWFMKGAWPTATFGSLSVDLVRCEGELATPAETSTWGNVKALFR